MLYFLYQDAIQFNEIETLLLRAILSDPLNADIAPLTQALIEAYIAIHPSTTDDGHEPLKLITGASAAESVFSSVYRKVYGEEETGSWPDSLPFDEALVYPRKIIITAAALLAKHDLARRNEFFKYMKEHTEVNSF